LQVPIAAWLSAGGKRSQSNKVRGGEGGGGVVGVLHRFWSSDHIGPFRKHVEKRLCRWVIKSVRAMK